MPVPWRARATGQRTRNAGSCRRSAWTRRGRRKNPVVSAKGAVVTNIADIPAALTAVMELNGVAPDFPSAGSLALKPWIANDQGLTLPGTLAMHAVRAKAP